MTYKYSKKRGWVGFCDGPCCNHMPFKPYRVSLFSEADRVCFSNKKVFEKYKHRLFFGVCEQCEWLGPKLHVVVTNMVKKYSVYQCVIIDGVIVI